MNQIYDIFVTSYIEYLWLRYTMKATESVQITIQLLKYVMCDGVTFPNDSCFMTLVASSPKYFIDVILLLIHCSHGLNLGIKKQFLPANLEQHYVQHWLVLISYCLIRYHKHFGKNGGHIGYWGVLLTGNLLLTKSIAFACFENTYLEINILYLW